MTSGILVGAGDPSKRRQAPLRLRFERRPGDPANDRKEARHARTVDRKGRRRAPALSLPFVKLNCAHGVLTLATCATKRAAHIHPDDRR
jgi:hypothetical protein